MDSKERRNELARKRYATRKLKYNREMLEALLLNDPTDEIATIAYDLLGTGEYAHLDKRTREMLFGEAIR
jgi:hypothetical protein